MSDHDKALWLPFMCAGLVLSLELLTKGVLTTIIIGTSSAALFGFFLFVVNYLNSKDDETSLRQSEPDYPEVVFDRITLSRHAFLPSGGAREPAQDAL